jgi:hypothetical protein
VSDLDRYRRLTRLADEAVRIPVIGIRVGLDPLVGLVPGIGDLAGGALSAYGILVGWRAGAPGAVLFRMVLNVGVDTLVGEIPLLGDLFDFGWKSNTRNYRLLEQYLARPDHTKRTSLLLLALLGALLLGILALGIWLAVAVAARLFHLIGAS